MWHDPSRTTGTKEELGVEVRGKESSTDNVHSENSCELTIQSWEEKTVEKGDHWWRRAQREVSKREPRNVKEEGAMQSRVGHWCAVRGQEGSTIEAAKSGKDHPTGRFL